MLELYELEVFDCAQNSPEWSAARAGVVSASMFSTVMAKGRSGADSKTRKTYMQQLAAERIVRAPCPTWDGNADTERGHEQEPEARSLYAFIRDAEPTQVGFLRRGPVGCSPDSLISDDGLLEIKTRKPHLQVALLEAGTMPPEHKAQVQGQLWISGRKWLDFMSYSPGLPPFITRIERDPVYMADMAKAIREFLTELDALEARIRSMQEAA
jgi:hypothetical protein